jgi:hypothetical protein
MPSIETNRRAENWYTRTSGWNNHIYARLLTGLAVYTSGLANIWRGSGKNRLTELARFQRNLARYIDQPAAARLLADPQLLKQSLLEATGFTVLLALLITWTLLSIYGFLVIPIIPIILLVVALSLLFTQLLNLLALSGDIYQKSRDEGQRQSAFQASSTTLRLTGFCLIALSLVLAFIPAWRAWSAIDLGVLVLFARLVYLARLLQLRWSALALVELEEEHSSVREAE